MYALHLHTLTLIIIKESVPFWFELVLVNGYLTLKILIFYYGWNTTTAAAATAFFPGQPG